MVDDNSNNSNPLSNAPSRERLMEKLIVKPSDLIMVNVANVDLDYAVKGKTYKNLNQHMRISGLFPAILGKGPWPKLEKNDQLNIKIERN